MAKARICRLCGKPKPIEKFPMVKRWRLWGCYACAERARRERERRKRVAAGAELDDPESRAERAKRIPGYAQAAARGRPLPYVDGHHTPESLIEDAEGIPQVQGEHR